MSETNSQPSYDETSDVIWQRLVDGELSEVEYRTLLLSLDDEPGGWQRCALAFLESQALAQDLAAWKTATAQPSHASVPLPERGTKEENEKPTGDTISLRSQGSSDTTNQNTFSESSRWIPLMAAACAAWLMAFGLGMAVRGWWPASDVIVPPNNSIAGHQQNTDVKPLVQQTAENRRALIAETEAPQFVKLVMNGREMQLPVARLSSDTDRQLVSPTRSMIPEEIVHALERLGHQVERRHHYVPLESLDGHPVVVPLEDVKIVPVSGRGFQ